MRATPTSAEWARPYEVMAREDTLAWPTLSQVMAAASAFLDPMLVEGLDAQWDPRSWAWQK